MKKRTITVKSIVLAAALLMIVSGLFSDGFRDVMRRAVVICLECIGIG
jgi:hypothetical protein